MQAPQRGRGKGTRNYKQRYVPTEDELNAKAEKDARRREREQEARQKKLERELRWPKMKVDYEPDVWKQKYREDHYETFSKSVKKLQGITEMCEEEAERTLLDILIKITFIETNLTVHGEQDAETLFDNLQLAQNGAPTIPFASLEDLAAFCDSMPLNFRKDRKKYRNTGVQGRRLVHYLKDHLDLVGTIDVDGFDDVKEEFCKTITTDESDLKKFADQEAGLDYSSFWYLAAIIPGFHYDKTKRSLSLTRDAAHYLPINLPIFADTLNSSHPSKLDYSRQTSCFVNNLYTGYPARMNMMVVSVEPFQATAALFRSNIQEKPPVLERSFAFAHGCISPNNYAQQVEFFKLEPTTLCFTNNVCTESSGRFLNKDGKLELSEFETAMINEEYRKRKIISRARVVNVAPVERAEGEEGEVEGAVVEEEEDGEIE